MSGLLKRIISALVLGCITVAAVWYGGWAFYALTGVVFAVSVQEWSRLSLRDGRVRWGLLAAGIVYVALACWSAIWLRGHESAGLYLLLYVFAAIWACDSGAYFAGKTIGGPKMAPAISPNKTWAGMIGGALSAAFATILVTHFLKPYEQGLFLQTVPLPLHAVFGAFLAVVGQAGDLMISRLKRLCGLKDTGCIIPGHGGLLDRIDALLLALPIFAAIVAVTESWG